MRIQQEIEALRAENSDLKSKIKRLEDQVHSLQQWQSIVVKNWMRRVENLLDTTIDAKWSCPNCQCEFENLTEFLEHIVANINVLESKLAQHLEDEDK